MQIMLVTRTLGLGGAERQLVNLATHLLDRGVRVSVLSFYPGGELKAELNRANIPVLSLDRKGWWDIISMIWRFLQVIQRCKPDVVYGILNIPNILILLSKLISKRILVVWRLPASSINFDDYDWRAVLSDKLETMLSRIPDIIIANSHAGKRSAEIHGFRSNNITVIPNGFDTQLYRPDNKLRRRQRLHWQLAEKLFVIGIVGRLDPIKDHFLFMDVAKIILEQEDEIHFVCIGDGSRVYRESLIHYAKRSVLADHLLWTGNISDMKAAYNALDLLLLTSKSEGLPNVVGEAMACGIPCVATDVGDLVHLVADTGVVVKGRNPSDLAKACTQLHYRLNRGDRQLKDKARDRITENYSMSSMIQSTLSVIHQHSKKT